MCRSRRRRTRRSPYPRRTGRRKEPSISPEAPEYTYLEIPKSPEARSCLGIVLAGLAARAEVGVGGLEEAVSRLEDAHSVGEHTRYRFSVEQGKIFAQVEQSEDSDGGGWRTLVELFS